MIIVELCGGLGNQLFQYASATSLARYHKERMLLDLSWYAKQDSRSFIIDKFMLPTRTISPRFIPFLKKEILILIDSVLKLKLHHKEIVDPIWEELSISQLGPSVHLKGYWLYKNYFNDYLPEFREVFQLKPEFHTPEYQKLLQLTKLRTSVSVHIRRGDYTEDVNKGLFAVLSMEYYIKSIAYMRLQISEPLFIVFSDDIQWVKEHIVFTKDTIFASEDLNADYLEFDIMRQCQHAIIANSTFSWWAAQLNPNRSKIIIQPTMWYTNPLAQKKYDSGMILRIPNAIRL